MWEIKDGKKQFLYGKEDREHAEEAARLCGSFRRDYEEECFYEEELTCYNCRYRRWTVSGFQCMKKEK